MSILFILIERLGSVSDSIDIFIDTCTYCNYVLRLLSVITSMNGK